MNVTHRQRHEVGRFPNGKSHLFFCPLATLRFSPMLNQFSTNYEQTTANPKMNISRMSSKWSKSCRSEQRKKTSVLA